MRNARDPGDRFPEFAEWVEFVKSVSSVMTGSPAPMPSAVRFTRRAFAIALVGGAIGIGTACPQPSDGSLEGIRALHAQERYGASLAQLQALMDEDPTDPEVNYLYGKALMETGEYARAIWALRRAAESTEYAFDAGMLLAQATLDSATPDQTIAAVDIALAAKPDDVGALALRAQAYLHADHPAKALADVERAIELDPDHPAILVPRVLALLALERVDEAEAVLDATERESDTAERPDGEEIQARLCLTDAALASDRGDDKSAEVMYADCLDAYPAAPLVVLQVADFYDSIGRPEHATALLRRTFEETRAARFGWALARRFHNRAREVQPDLPPAGAV